MRNFLRKVMIFVSNTLFFIQPSGDSDTETDEDFYPQESLLSQIADAQTKQREKLAYEQLTAGGQFLYLFSVNPNLF